MQIIIPLFRTRLQLPREGRIKLQHILAIKIYLISPYRYEQLLELVRGHKLRLKMYAPDTTAQEHLSASSIFTTFIQPIQFYRTDMGTSKGFQADRSTTFKINNTKKNGETDHTPILVWDNCVRHAGSVQEEILEPIFINTIISSVLLFSGFCQLPTVLKNQKHISGAEFTAILR
jgi:hypothetical protein